MGLAVVDSKGGAGTKWVSGVDAAAVGGGDDVAVAANGGRVLVMVAVNGRVV